MKKTVLVYNPISGHGHLDSWNAMFVALLLERGWQVFALTPNPDALRLRLRRNGFFPHGGLYILNWDTPTWQLRTLLGWIWRRWNTIGDRFFYKRPGSEAAPHLPLGEYLKRRTCQLVIPFLFRASHFLYSRYRRLRAPETATGQVDPEQHLTSPLDIAIRVNAALRKIKLKPLLGFNMYMDHYKTTSADWQRFSHVNRLPWAGIQFVPATAPTEGWYESPHWRGMCFLDPSVCLHYSKELPTQRFGFLPDITEPSLPDQPTPLATQIRQRASGRVCVFLGGSIGGQKNLARWFEVIQRADPTRWFFVQVGEIHRGTLSAEDLACLDHFLEHRPENFLIEERYLPDEQAFNDVIRSCDIVYAVYRNFRISSNMPGKAAHFRKPIIVSDQYLLGARVKRYGIGLAVNESDSDSILSGLQQIASLRIPDEHFDQYCHDFSPVALAAQLDEFLQNCLK